MVRGVAIVNPKSGRGMGSKRLPQLKREIERRGLSIDVVETVRPRHATELARQATADGADLVLACGGDGTLNEVVNGLVGSAAAFAPVPFGTGNDFCRTVGVGVDWLRALDAVSEGRTIPIDVGLCTSEGDSTHFINVAGCGFDVDVAVRINQGIRILRGTAAYIAGVLGAFATYKAEWMSIEVDGVAFDDEVMLCAIANATSYGGSMRIAPDARIDDGYFDVVVVRRTSKLEFLSAFPRVFKGTHLGHPKVSSRRGRIVRLQTREPRPMLVDGELFGSTPIEISLLPNALRCVVPAGFQASVPESNNPEVEG